MVSSTICCGAEISVRLHWTPIASLLASDSMRAMSASAVTLERERLYVIVTLAPREARSKAMAWPIPRDAPVTMALSFCQPLHFEVFLLDILHFAFRGARLLDWSHSRLASSRSSAALVELKRSLNCDGLSKVRSLHVTSSSITLHVARAEQTVVITETWELYKA